MSLECDACGRKTNSQSVCGYCRQWRCPDCLEEEMTPLGPTLACVRCRKERAAAIQRWPKPTCQVCGFPRIFHGCRDGCAYRPIILKKDDPE
jgi:hypothetical protein